MLPIRSEWALVDTARNAEAVDAARIVDSQLDGNSAAGDAITRAEIGDVCYIVDDETVAKTNGTSTRSAAGTIRDVDAQGVWVEI